MSARLRTAIPAALFAVLALTACGPALFAEAAARSQWSPAKYAQFDAAKFARFAPAQQEIDLEAVDYPLLHAAILYETNRRRTGEGLNALKHLPGLEAAAVDHCQDMARLGFFSHQSPVAGRRTPVDRMKNHGIDTGFRAENIAQLFAIQYESGRPVYGPQQNGGYFSYKLKGEPIPAHTYNSFAKEVLTGWMNSPGHRENILFPEFRYMGAGTKLLFGNGGMPMVFAAQNFGSHAPGDPVQ